MSYLESQADSDHYYLVEQLRRIIGQRVTVTMDMSAESQLRHYHICFPDDTTIDLYCTYLENPLTAFKQTYPEYFI